MQEVMEGGSLMVGEGEIKEEMGWILGEGCREVCEWLGPPARGE